MSDPAHRLPPEDRKPVIEDVDSLPVADIDDAPVWGWGDNDSWGSEEEEDGRTRILLASPHAIFTEALAWLLEGMTEDFDIVAEALSVGELRVLTADATPDVVVVDMAFPGEDYVSIILSLLAERPSLPILALTDSASSVELRDVLEAGAKGYLLKNAKGAEVVDTINRIKTGEVVMSSELIDMLADAVSPRNQMEDLTRRELQVLDLLEKGMSDQRISSILSISIRTVQKHLTNMYKKCDVTSRNEMIAFARRRGVGLRR